MITRPAAAILAAAAVTLIFTASVPSRPLLGSTPEAQVAQAPSGQSADELFAEGERLAQARRYGDALDFFLRALALYREKGNRSREASTLGWLGRVYYELRQYLQAREMWVQALGRYQELQDTRMEATTLSWLGRVSFLLREYAPAREMFTRAIARYREVQDRQGEAIALYELGQIHYRLREYAPARDVWTQALIHFRALQDRDWENRVLFDLGRAHLALKEYAQARDVLVLALQTARERQDRLGEGIVLNQLGDAYLKLGQLDRAREAWTQALEIAREMRQREGEAFALANLGRVTSRMLQEVQARDLLVQAAAIFKDLQLTEAEGEVLHDLGFIYFNLGQYAQARDTWARALAIHRQLGKRNFEAAELVRLGMVYYSLGDPLLARQLHTEALALYQRLGDREGEGVALDGIAGTYSAVGMYADARRFALQAIARFREVGERGQEALTQEDLARIYLKLGDPGRAREAALNALAAWRDLGVAVFEAGARITLADVHAELREYPQALEIYTQVLEFIRSLPFAPRVMLSSATAGQGRVLEKLGRPADALRSYRLAIGAVEELRAEVDRPAQRVAFLTRQIAVYDALTALLIRRSGGAPQAAEEAFVSAERGRARGLLDLMAEARARVAVGVDPPLVTREAGLRAELGAVEERWRQEVTKPRAQQDRAALEVFTKKRVDLEGALREVRATIMARHPRYAELLRPRVATAAEIRAALRPGEVLLEYFLTDDLAAVWVARADHPLRLRMLPGTGRDLAPLIAKLGGQVSTPARAVPVSPTRPAPGKVPAGFDQSLAARLYSILIRPVEADIADAGSLFVVPHGALFSLPLEVLTPGPGRRFLGEQYVVAYLPSASLLMQVRTQQSRAASALRRPFVGIADPVYAIADPDGQGLVANPGADQVRGALRNPVAGLRALSLARIPYTAHEARQIGALFGASEASGDLYLRRRAQESIIKSLDFTRYRYVHFATHGLLGNEVRGAWLQPALVLSLVGDPRNDGFLQMDEILNLRLNADLVTLSACQTGLGTQVRGEGLVGLTRAFMYAGTPTVVVSLWNVSDPATATLMTEFYKNLKAGMPKAKALQEAKRTLRTQGYRDETGKVHDASSPFYWAPFILVGEPN